MQCDRIRIIVDQSATKDSDILPQVLFDKVWMKIAVGCNLFLHCRPFWVDRIGRKGIRNRAHENV